MTKYQEYALLKAEIKEREAKAKQLEIELITELSDMDGNKLKTDFATFSLMSKKKFEYSLSLQEKESIAKEQIKLLKHKEEFDGTAKCLQDGWMLRCTLTK
jgi:hypothetical protein